MHADYLFFEALTPGFGLCAGAVLTLLIQPVLADYNFDRVPSPDRFVRAAYGTVRGSVYVDGGHGVGPSPSTQSFNVTDVNNGMNYA